MAQDKPVIDTARVNFSGMSEEAFEDLGETNVGDIRIFTIKARVKGYSAVDMAEAGVRRLANLKILKVVEGVSEKVKEDGDGQPTLFDKPTAVPDPDPDDDPEADPDESYNGEFQGGPQFSGGEDE